MSADATLDILTKFWGDLPQQGIGQDHKGLDGMHGMALSDPMPKQASKM